MRLLWQYGADYAPVQQARHNEPISVDIIQNLLSSEMENEGEMEILLRAMKNAY